MIMVIVERVLGAFDETEFVTRAVRQAVTTLAGSDIRLRVAPEMVEPLRRSLAEESDARLLRVEADAGIKPGDCQIVTPAGNIDVGLAAQSRALRNDLQQRLSTLEMTGSNWQRA
jgi:type III secretion protein L